RKHRYELAAGHPGAHDDCLRTALARLAHVVRVLRHGAHHVHGDHAASLRDGERRADLAVERDQVRLPDRGPIAALAGRRHEAGMVTPEIDARDGAEGAEPGDRAGETVRRDPDAHAALHDRQQAIALEYKRGWCVHSW